MNLTKRPLLLAAILILSGARPASAQLLERCDKPMSDATALAQEISTCAAGLTEAAKRPPAARSSGKTWAELPAGKVPPEIWAEAKTEPLAGEIYTYFSYIAYAAGDRGRCAPLKLVGLERYCRREFTRLALERAWLGSAAEFNEACANLESRTKTDKETPGKEFTAECCAIAEKSRKTADPCAPLVPRCMPDAPRCRHFTSNFTQDIAHCQRYQLGNDSGCENEFICKRAREACRGDALLVKALRAKDPSLCGAETRCRVMMGEAAKVLPQVEKELSKTAAGAYFVSRGWERPGRTAIDPPMKPPTPGGTPVTLPSKHPGFKCQDPLDVTANTKLAADTIYIARSCLKMVDSLLPVSDVQLILQLDEREEKLIRLSEQIRKDFDGGDGAPAQRKN